MFEWDVEKNAANIAKHGIGFERAMRVFEGTVLTVVDNRFDYGEVREISIGQIDGLLFLTIVHTKRGGVTRIISARSASRSERERYEQAVGRGAVD